MKGSNMTRRTALKVLAAVAVASVVPSHEAETWHTYENSDGEQIAGRTLEEAARYLDCELGGADDFDPDDWFQVDDHALIPVRNSDDGTVETKTAAEWAAEHSEPGYVASTYC